jgi:hypothetical protein
MDVQLDMDMDMDMDMAGADSRCAPEGLAHYYSSQAGNAIGGSHTSIRQYANTPGSIITSA